MGEVMNNWQVKLAHDRVLLTGAGSGIGRSLAIEMADLGVTVYGMGRRKDALEETASMVTGSGRVVPLSGDITKPESVEEVFSAIEADGGPVQAFANLAVDVNYMPALDLTNEIFYEQTRSALFGVFHIISRWAKPLVAAGLPGVGAIVSSALCRDGTPGIAHSSAARAGAEALIKTLSREWAQYGIRLNAMGLGAVIVPRTEPAYRSGAMDESIQQIALHRPAEIREASAPLMFLLSEAASYMTGEVMIVDGGLRLPPMVVPKFRWSATAAWDEKVADVAVGTEA
jgi:NAD(P)-dependent dehydrogenase (short-subunit alcohol dehydrogenase family)